MVKHQCPVTVGLVFDVYLHCWRKGWQEARSSWVCTVGSRVETSGWGNVICSRCGSYCLSTWTSHGGGGGGGGGGGAAAAAAEGPLWHRVDETSRNRFKRTNASTSTRQGAYTKEYQELGSVMLNRQGNHGCWIMGWGQRRLWQWSWKHNRSQEEERRSASEVCRANLFVAQKGFSCWSLLSLFQGRIGWMR